MSGKPMSPTSEEVDVDAIYINGPQPTAAVNGSEQTPEPAVRIILRCLFL